MQKRHPIIARCTRCSREMGCGPRELDWNGYFAWLGPRRPGLMPPQRPGYVFDWARSTTWISDLQPPQSYSEIVAEGVSKPGAPHVPLICISCESCRVDGLQTARITSIHRDAVLHESRRDKPHPRVILDGSATARSNVYDGNAVDLPGLSFDLCRGCSSGISNI